MRKQTDAVVKAVVKAGGRVAVQAACIAWVAGLSTNVYAQVGEGSVRAVRDIGRATRAWLELQRSGREAAPAQPMLGAEAGLAYERYLKSFDTKIPSRFDSAVGSGGRLRIDYLNRGGSSAADGTD